VTTFGFSGPTCLSKASCEAGGGGYASFFPEGAPCGRVAGAEACAAGLVCCNKTLTCATEAACEAAPVPPELAVSAEPIACGGDSDCAQGICCGISWTQRDGVCSGVADCAAGNGIVTPRPDAGVVMDAGPQDPPDAGGPPPLVEQICEAAFCEGRGPKVPSAFEKQACAAAFAAGTDALGRSGLVASPACLDAVSASRGVCRYVLAWRDGVVPAVQGGLPVFPGDCYSPALTHPLAEPACATLEGCGLVSDRAACAGWLGGLTHDTLVRIAEAPDCALDADALGFAGRPLLGKCTEDAHCPAGATCEADLAPGGVCTILGCADPGACAELGGACAAGVCTLTCNPHITNVQARRTVKQSCAARVHADGRPSDFGCARQGSGQGVCVPAADPEACMGGLEPLRGQGYGPLEHAFVCGAVSTSTLTLFSRCPVPGPGGPNPCGEGVCVGDGTEGTCLAPCVSTPVDVDAPMCPEGQACMHDPEVGWGGLGYCRMRCDGGRLTCPMGTSCERSFPASFCR